MNIKKKKIEITILFLIFLLVVLFLQLRFYNLSSNHYDTGVELHDTYKIFKGETHDLFRGHFKIIKLPLSQIFQLNNIYFISISFFVLQTLSILNSLFFIGEQDKSTLLNKSNNLELSSRRFSLRLFLNNFFLVSIKKNQNFALCSYVCGFIKKLFYISIINRYYYFLIENKMAMYLLFL